MQRLLNRVVSGSVIFTLLVIPVSTLGATTPSALTTADKTVVTRGDFIRASVKTLGIATKKAGTLPYKRALPKLLEPYVRPAFDKGALSIFGDDLAPSKGITRAEAAFVLTTLKDVRASRAGKTFKDVPADSKTKQAIDAAVELGWMKAKGTDSFGAAEMLLGAEAKSMLKKASGEGSSSHGDSVTDEVPTQVIHLDLKKKAPKELPNEALLRTVWQMLVDQYLYQEKLSPEEAGYRAAEALVESVKDPYTTFLRPLPAAEFQNQIGGEVSGIGAQVEYKDNILTIVSPLRGSPAEKAGLKPGDQILQVDGKPLEGLSFLEAVSKVRGPRGSTAVLHIRRNGIESNVDVKRDNIKVPEIDITYQEGMVIVKLLQFGQLTENELRSLMTDVQTHNPSGIILDLRNNPGGLLDAAEKVLSNFLPKGSAIASINARVQSYDDDTKDEPTINASVPVVVLVNGGSASASEIVAGALQDYKRATIVGEKSFGKGTVQQVVEFRDGSGLKMTIAEWKTPKGRKIDGVGVMPDVVLVNSTDRDEQMLKAMSIIRDKR